MLIWFMFFPFPPSTPLLYPMHNSTVFYMCHWSRPISILLIFALGWLFRVNIPNHIPIDSCDQAVIFYSVFLLPQFFLRIVPDHCLAASREVHYIQFYHSVSVSVYNVLLVLLLLLCIDSWRLLQFTWNSPSSLFLWTW